MKKILILLMTAATLAFTPACKKSSNNGGTQETTLAVQTTPANGSTDAPAPGPDFPLIVQITSTMPSGGVKIQVSAKKDGSSDPAFFNPSPTTTNSPTTNITITGTPAATVCVVTVTVTSLSNSSNVWNGSYRYSRK